MYKSTAQSIATLTPASTPAPEEHLSDLSPKDKPWDQRRDETQSLEERLQEGHHRKYARRMQFCSPDLEFATHTNPETGEWGLKLHAARFCRVRHCPVCQWRRSLMHKARFIQSLPTVFETVPESSRWVLLTLTVRNCAIGDLKETIISMQTAFKRLTKRAEWSQVLGWVRATEVTRNPSDNTAHPHLHILMLVSPEYFTGRGYIKQSLWQKAWKESARLDYDPVVDVRTITLSKKKRAERMKAESAGEEIEPLHLALAATAAAEVLKYSTKATDLIQAPQDWLETFIDQVHKLRFVGPGGVLKKALQNDKDDDDLVHVSDDGIEPDEEKTDPDTISFQYGRETRRYSRRRD